MTKTASSNSHLPQISDPGRLGRGLRQALARGLLALLLVLPGALAAQDQAPRSPVLVVDFDEVFRLSQRGQEILEEFELRSRELADEIAETRRLANILKVSGTPTFVFQDQMVRGYVPLNAMEQIVEDQRGG